MLRSIIIMLVFSFLSVSCLKKSGQDSSAKALSSNDWFKDGVDRFYLAHLASGSFIDSQYDVRYGEQFLLGIGCYGEPKDPEALTDVPVSKSGSIMTTKKLNERVYLHEFPVVDNKDKPKKGECRVLLGEAVEPRQITNGQELGEGGDMRGLLMGYMGSGLSCSMFVLATAQLVTTAIAGGYATAQTAGAAGPLVIPPLLLHTAAVGSSAYFCGVRTGHAIRGFSRYQVKENHKVLASAMDEASRLTNIKINESGFAPTYQKLVETLNPEKRAIAAGVWNKYFVRSFNKEVNGQFENGWGKETKFFDAVSQIQTDLLGSGKTYRH
jgi:hypothetical protein